MILLTCALATAVAASPQVRPSPRVGATIPPLADIVRQVAGEGVDVVLILPPGASPHTFEPTASVVRRLAGVKTIFAIGHGLDDWAASMGGAAGAGPVTVVDGGIALRRLGGGPGGASSADPHYWLSCANAKQIAATVAARLALLFPDRAADLASRRRAYDRELGAADDEIRALLAPLPTSQPPDVPVRWVRPPKKGGAVGASCRPAAFASSGVSPGTVEQETT